MVESTSFRRDALNLEENTMPAPRAKLGSNWLSPTDIRSTITRIQQNRTRHASILTRIGEQVESHRASVERSLRGLDARDRTSVINKSVSGHRADLIRETAEPRKLLTRELEQLRQSVQSASTHYRSPVQMLTRETLGSERRSRIMQQIAGSGPAELASLAEYAAAQKDKDLGAALCGRVADLPRAERPFSAGELADVMCGELHRELSQAMVEAERRVLEALEDEQIATTGKGNAQRSLEIAMLKKHEREIGAYAPDHGVEDDEEVAE
ncbi:hypothetical protein ASE49_13360 [Novosphingobium sp. Leaf2]|nr:hypothetical protein ASE49_13360 [Novosphingobium sp. Leaf2]